MVHLTECDSGVLPFLGYRVVYDIHLVSSGKHFKVLRCIKVLTNLPNSQFPNEWRSDRPRFHLLGEVETNYSVHFEFPPF